MDCIPVLCVDMETLCLVTLTALNLIFFASPPVSIDLNFHLAEVYISRKEDGV